MRLRPVRQHWIATALLSIGLVSAIAPAAAHAQSAKKSRLEKGLADNQLASLSLQKQWAAEHALNAKKTDQAIELFEAALAADPRNSAAYIGLGRAALQNNLPGTAVRYYREALGINPNDLVALEEQGLALVQRGAKGRAEENLAKLQQLCGSNCPQSKKLSVAIAAIQTAKTEPQADEKTSVTAEVQPATPTSVETDDKPEAATDD